MSDDLSQYLYEKCKHCHLFVEPNSSFVDSTAQYPIAEYVHLHRGDEADEALDSTHEARPSGLKANLLTWMEFGPAAMQRRFVETEVARRVWDEAAREANAYILLDDGIDEEALRAANPY
jgi:hypothetical protein